MSTPTTIVNLPIRPPIAGLLPNKRYVLSVTTDALSNYRISCLEAEAGTTMDFTPDGPKNVTVGDAFYYSLVL